jgi:hypothetical protein
MDNKKYNVTVAPMYSTSTGNYMSITITPGMFDDIQKLEIGGKLFMKVNKNKKGEKSPDAYLEYLDKSEVERFNNSRAKPQQDDGL